MSKIEGTDRRGAAFGSNQKERTTKHSKHTKTQTAKNARRAESRRL
jgi:hypothetical protein